MTNKADERTYTQAQAQAMYDFIRKIAARDKRDGIVNPLHIHILIDDAHDLLAAIDSTATATERENVRLLKQAAKFAEIRTGQAGTPQPEQGARERYVVIGTYYGNCSLILDTANNRLANYFDYDDAAEAQSEAARLNAGSANAGEAS